ncbi:uncharacterized protein LOC125236333 isoform X1 [Leguminivora glycinivorella]|uniref:uncharacterized protein LOC125236333 isoform X1 n=2 Tax=Leguminivora glycinivorella TaxID=1035111 RepID=UPI00200F2824|nr:uncharacterized protein LOC125236333 isoform X1 [Leguminivora glycinivorella]
MYDPLGLLSPAIIIAKILLQKLWLCRLDWDSEVPNDVASAWRKYILTHTQHIHNVRIPRYVMNASAHSTQLHFFCDASQAAYGTCAYVRTVSGDNNESEHIRLLHAPPSLLLSTVKDCWWPLGGTNLAKRVVRTCVTCIRMKAQTFAPIMGNLPSLRLDPGFAFMSCGVDYAGPVYVLNRRGRGAKPQKAYICLIVCFTTRAVYLDLVTNLSTEGYLLALKRFISRRGKPNVIYSDNGRNFVGAMKELSSFLQGHADNIIECASNENINLHFNPPYAPHMSGLCERAVQSCKYHLKRVIGNANLTFEEFSTVLAQAEALLNSRPMHPLSTDPNDLSALTPAHFLIGRPLTAPPCKDLTAETGRLPRYEMLEKMRQHFWQRWSKQYISELQTRTKWQTQGQDIVLNALVLVKEDNLPPLKWRLGRVVALFTGNDGVSRVADVKTANGTIRRAFTKLCPLLMPPEGDTAPTSSASPLPH